MNSYFSNFYDMFQFLGLLCFVFLLGSVTALFVVAFIFYKYLNFSSALYKKSTSRFKSFSLFIFLMSTGLIFMGFSSKLLKEVCFSEILKENLSLKPNSSVESCRYLNILLAFFFNEWRDTATVQRWIVKKVNVEIEELLETKAAKRLLSNIKINDVSLGTSPPIIHATAIKEPLSFSGDVIPDRIVVDVDVEYEGEFYLAVDVGLRFGKSAFVSITIRKLEGRVRLQFNRLPCTHWSICFVDEPTLDVKINTNFLSRPLPQLGSLILNQVYRTIRKKHTFPRYKIRYTPINPFWIDRMTTDDSDDVAADFIGLDVTIVSCTRLLLPHTVNKLKDSGTSGVVFATVSLDAVSCVGLELARPDSSDSKKNNFLLTSIVDVLGEVDNNFSNKDLNQPPDIAPAEAENETSPPKIVLNDGNPSPDTSLSDPPKVWLNLSDKKSASEECDSNNNSKDLTADASGLMRNQEEAGKGPGPQAEGARDGTSYMMVTRNFSAVLSEEVSTKADGFRAVNVLVGSIVWNRSAGMKATISEGDKILSINGHPVNSLSQAIAVINKIRSEKSRFFFKVQRNKRRSRGVSFKSTTDAADVARGRSVSTPIDFLFDKYSSSDDTNESSQEDDTESDFTDLDTEEQESFINEGIAQEKKKMLPSSSTPSHGIRQLLISDVIKTSSRRTEEDSSADDEIKFAQILPSSLTHQTSFCDFSQSRYSWPNDVFSLQVEKEHRYLNVRFWYKEVATTSPVKKDNLTLVGALAVSLRFLQRHCSMMTSGNFTRRFKVLSPLAPESDVKQTAERIFKQRTGFKLEHCYGDVTLSTKAVTLT